MTGYSFERAPDLGLFKISSCPFRPLAQSLFLPTPWLDRYDDSYIPSIMSQAATVKGLIKAADPELLMNEDLILRAEKYMYDRFKSIWTLSSNDLIMAYEDALFQLDLNKSPGDDYFYRFQTKRDALEHESDLIATRTGQIIDGFRVPCRFALTDKSELRHIDKVREEKTRVFMAAGLHHLLASIQLFQVQNDLIMASLGQHPITIGVQLPGPEFIHLITRMGNKLNDGDVSGCDLRFKLRVARCIRNLRASYLPRQYHEACCWIYDTVYCGLVVGLGGVYRCYGNKSGWLNTGHDNSIMTWFMFVCASFHFYPDLMPEQVIDLLVNGDDLLVRMVKGEFRLFCNWFNQYGFFVEADNYEQRDVFNVVYLSHSCS